MTLNRRSFFAALSAVPLLAKPVRLSTGKRLRGIANFRPMNSLARELVHGKCFVDGREVKGVHYADTDNGFVMVDDLRGVPCVPMRLADGRCHLSMEWPRDTAITQGVHIIPRGTIARVIHGEVELFGPVRIG